MIKAVAARLLTTFLATLLTERFLINVLVIIGDRLVQSWGNDLSERLWSEFKDALDRDKGTPVNLYNEIKFKGK